MVKRQLIGIGGLMMKRFIKIDPPQLRRFLMVAIPYSWLGIFFLIPILYVALVSLAQPIFGMPPYSSIASLTHEGMLQLQFYIENYRILYTDPLYIHAYWTSLKMASAVTFLCLLLAYPMAFAITRRPKSQQTYLLLLILMPFWTAFLLRVYAWMGILSPSGLINSALLGLGWIHEPLPLLYNDWAVMIGMTYCYLPFMIFPLYAALSEFRVQYLEAAYDLGCRPFNAFFQILLPLTKKGIMTGCIFVFVPATGEFIIPELLGSSRTLMMGRVLWTEFFSNRDWPMASALAVVLLLPLLVPLLFIHTKKVRDA